MNDTTHSTLAHAPSSSETVNSGHSHSHEDACGCGHDHHHHGHHHHAPVVTYQRSAPKVGRNDPCPCGSGKKHKKCCLETARP
ncbi:MAG: SEC-C metal-binding domain-containing protein [Hyphomicrobiaceae bacterium]|nr:SEC-C metal-binding domain-containing protein [Hyphomicrobiaceae bacterium]